jgi:hypothetical protein
MIKYLLVNDAEFTEPFPSLNFVGETLVHFDYQGTIISGGGLYCEPG